MGETQENRVTHQNGGRSPHFKSHPRLKSEEDVKGSKSQFSRVDHEKHSK